MCERCAVFPNRLEAAAKRHNVAVVYSEREPFADWCNTFCNYGINVRLYPKRFTKMSSVLADKPELVVFDDESYDQEKTLELSKKNIGCAVASGNFDIAEDVMANGADQFIALPVNPRVALSYLRAVIARRSIPPNSIEGMGPIYISGVEVDYEGRKILRDNREVSITPTAWSVLKIFLENPGKVLTGEQLERPLGESDTRVSMLVGILRKAIEKDPKNPRHFINVRSIGYKFVRTPKTD